MTADDTGAAPSARAIVVHKLSAERIDLRPLTSVARIDGRAGACVPLKYQQEKDGLRVRLPGRPFEELAYVLRLEFAGGFRRRTISPCSRGRGYRISPGSAEAELVLGGDLSNPPLAFRCVRCFFLHVVTRP